jgi:serine/threonine-protein kinase
VGGVSSDQAGNVRVVGRYALYGGIASGGMATVHLGRLLGPVGFSRTVAIKRLHAQYAQDPEFVSMFLDEARLAARIRHPNVVPTLDVVATKGELFLVMEYVPGESLSRLARAVREQKQRMPQRIVSSIMAGVLHGLHAAHEAKSERGEPLGIVHRDVSPQNVLVGTDGVARVLDFGVAKAAGRTQQTREGQIKGKLSYMAPEQLRGAPVSRQSDIYAAGVLLWELITGERLFSADNEGALLSKVLEGRIVPPSRYLVTSRSATISPDAMRILQGLDQVTLRALQSDPEKRYATAREMALALERCVGPATHSAVGEWIEHVAAEVLNERAEIVAEIESSASVSVPKDYMSSLGGATTVSAIPTGVRAAELERTMTEVPSNPSSGGPLSGEPNSQLSSISVARSAGRRTAGGGNKNLAAAVVGVAAALVLIAISIGVVVMKNKGEPAPATIEPKPVDSTHVDVGASPAADAGDTVTAADPAVATPPMTAQAQVTPVPTTTAAATLAAGTGGGSKPRGGGGGARSSPPTPKPAAPTPATTATPAAGGAQPPSDCVFWDSKGIKHVNPKCM